MLSIESNLMGIIAHLPSKIYLICYILFVQLDSFSLGRTEGISEWSFKQVIDLPIIEIDPRKARPVEINGTFGLTLKYAPDFTGIDIQRRFYIELAEKSVPSKELKIKTSDSIEFLGRNRDIFEIDEFLPHETQEIIGSPFDVILEEEKKVKAVKVRTRTRRYYFKTKARDLSAFVNFIEIESGGSLRVPITIYDMYDMERKHVILEQNTTLIGGVDNGSVIIPQVFPVGMGDKVIPYVKSSSSKEKPKFRYQELDTNLLKFSDEELWMGMPDTSARLSISAVMAGENLEALKNIGLIEGKWVFNSEHPLKGYQYFQDENGKRIPTNDLESDDFSSGEFPDDGFVPTLYNHSRIPIASHRWAALQPKNQIRPMSILTYHRVKAQAELAKEYADLYQKSGNVEFAYRGLLVLTRIGLEMKFRSFMQHYRTKADFDQIDKRLSTNTVLRKLSLSVLFGVGLEETRLMDSLINCYESLFSALPESSEKLVAFLRNKKLPITSQRDIQWLIERIYLTWLQANIHKQSYFNFPQSHLIVSRIIKLLDYPQNPLYEILFEGKSGTHYSFSSARHLLDKDYTKDGIKCENIGGYNTGAVNGTVEVLNELETLKNENDEVRYNRLNDALLSSIQLTMTPSIRARAKWGMADDQFNYESVHGSSFKMDSWHGRESFPFYYGDVWGKDSDSVFLKSFEKRKDARIAWSFLNTGEFSEIEKKKNAFGEVVWKKRKFPFSWEELRNSAATLRTNWRVGVSPVTSLNLNLLRRGKGIYERTCSLGLGATGRSLYDQMELKVFGFRSHLISRSGVKYGLVENAGRQNVEDGSSLTGYGSIFSNGKYFAFSDHELFNFKKNDAKGKNLDGHSVSYYKIYPKKCVQRRMNFLVDVGEKYFYLIDLYRMRGGVDHWRQMSLLPNAINKYEGVSILQDHGTSLLANEVSVLPSYGNHFVDVVSPKVFVSGKSWTLTSQVSDFDGLTMKLHSVSDGGARVYSGFPRLRDSGHRRKELFLGQEMVFWHHPKSKNNQDTYTSEVMNIIEFFGGECVSPQIHSVQRIKVSGPDESGFEPVGIEVKLKNRTDYFLLSASDKTKVMKLPNQELFELDGRVGFATYDSKDSLEHLEIIHGKSLVCGNHVIDSVPEISGKIVAVNSSNNRVVISTKVPIPDFITEEFLVGKMANIKKGIFKETYKIEEALLDENRNKIILRFHLPVISLKSKVTKISSNAIKLEAVYTDWNFSIHGSVVEGRSGKMFRIDCKDAPKGDWLFFHPQSQGKNFDGNTLNDEFTSGDTIKIYDYWLGDSIQIPVNQSRTIH